MAGLFGLGSWNEIGPEFFQNAMARGAQLGLSKRAQQREETSAADRLRLAYDQLHSQEKRAAEAEQVRLRVGLAAQQLRAQQMQNVLDFHKGELSLRERQLDLANRRESRLSNPASELDKFDMSMDKARLKQAQKELDETPIEEPHKLLPFGLGPIVGGNAEERAKKQQAVDALRQKIRGYKGKSRVRVKGPNGETGSVEEGTYLPEGWQEE